MGGRRTRMRLFVISGLPLRCVLPVAAIVVTVGMSGCKSDADSGPVAHWRGKVTIKGKEIPNDADARIEFMPEITKAGQKAKPASAQIVKGEYDAPHVRVGPVRVTFQIVRWAGQATTTAGADSSRPTPKWEFLVPKEHRDGMLFEIEEGELTKDFDL